jgi:hypothetical protein
MSPAPFQFRLRFIFWLTFCAALLFGIAKWVFPDNRPCQFGAAVAVAVSWTYFTLIRADIHDP